MRDIAMTIAHWSYSIKVAGESHAPDVLIDSVETMMENGFRTAEMRGNERTGHHYNITIKGCSGY